MEEKLTLYRVDQPKKPTTYQTAYNAGMAKTMHITETYRYPTGKTAHDAYEKLTARPATKEEAKSYLKRLLES
ncbi:MAG: hypothetical protein HFF11_01135 [Angelakisella sp.]|nr:hypothetical protein [Angelakisella sp.]